MGARRHVLLLSDFSTRTGNMDRIQGDSWDELLPLFNKRIETSFNTEFRCRFISKQSTPPHVYTINIYKHSHYHPLFRIGPAHIFLAGTPRISSRDQWCPWLQVGVHDRVLLLCSDGIWEFMKPEDRNRHVFGRFGVRSARWVEIAKLVTTPKTMVSEQGI